MIMYDPSVLYKDEKKDLIDLIDIFRQEKVSIDSFSHIVESFTCYFAHKDEIIYKIGSTNKNIYFLIEGSADCIVKANLLCQKPTAHSSKS